MTWKAKTETLISAAILAALALYGILGGRPSVAQTTGEQTFYGDVTFKNPVNLGTSQASTFNIWAGTAVAKGSGGTSTNAFAISSAATSGNPIIQVDTKNNLVLLSSPTVQGAGYVGLGVLKKADFDGMTPGAKGLLYFCTDCSPSPGGLCVSTGTAIGQFVNISSPTTGTNLMRGCGTGG